jgi:hypothetical protein
MMPDRKAARGRLGLASLALSMALLSMALVAGAPAKASGVSEQRVKAAFLINFARYVKWPSAAFDSASDPIVIGIYGDADFPEVVKTTVTGKEVAGRRLEVVEYSALESAAESHILFIGSSGTKNRSAIIRAMKNASVFSVSDSPGFAKAGGVANFVRTSDKIRFEINEEAVKEAGLSLSSKLLRLAILVN